MGKFSEKHFSFSQKKHNFAANNNDQIMDSNKTFTYEEAFAASLEYFRGDELAARVWVNKYAMKDTPDEKPDFSFLLSYGSESVMLDKLITETEKEMQSLRDAERRKDLQELDALTHHLRSSWEILRADQPLRELYGLLHGSAIPDYKALNKAVTAVLDKGSEIIQQAKEERRKYNNG